MTRRLLICMFGLAFSASTAGAYYHFYHYTNRTAPYNPVPEKFDLNAQPNKTVPFFLTDSSAAQFCPSSQFPSALAAIREGARVWNAVESSDLRVVFGGLAASSTPQNTPSADIVFDDLDPFPLGLPSANAGQNAVTSGPSGAFVPIRRPQIRLNRNLSNWSSPSLAEGFFLTVAHEMGHAMGLQHTFTSSLMSTEAAGRATSLYSPLTADDIAGISYLYPRGTLSQSTGIIAGRITSPGGQGIHLASVVAIRPTGPAVSAMTDPDGRYRIDGVPAGQYVLYVHPPPPSTRTGELPGWRASLGERYPGLQRKLPGVRSGARIGFLRQRSAPTDFFAPERYLCAAVRAEPGAEPSAVHQFRYSRAGRQRLAFSRFGWFDSVPGYE